MKTLKKITVIIACALMMVGIAGCQSKFTVASKTVKMENYTIKVPKKGFSYIDSSYNDVVYITKDTKNQTDTTLQFGVLNYGNKYNSSQLNKLYKAMKESDSGTKIDSITIDSIEFKGYKYKPDGTWWYTYYGCNENNKTAFALTFNGYKPDNKYLVFIYESIRFKN